MRRGVRWTSSVVVTGLVLLGSACDGSVQQPSGLSDEPSSTSASLGATTSASPDEQAVIAAYKGWFTTLNGLGNADEAEVRAALQPYAVDALVDTAVKFFAEKRAQGLMPGGTVEFAELVVAVDAQLATVTECRNGVTETTVEIATGKTAGTGVANTGYKASVRKEASGQWLLEDYVATEGQC